MERAIYVKRIYLCGSFKFLDEMEEIRRFLEAKKVHVLISKKTTNGILRCLEKIDASDAVYVVNPGGYVGKSVSVDIGYAYARNKPIYAMHAIDDPPVMNMVSGVISSEEFIDLIMS
jgi:nucleoside 2-deoxyribosyltransferase